MKALRSSVIAQARVALRAHLRATGFSLVEVVVALLIFSIGLLGFLSLQAMSLKANRSAHYRSVAVSLADQVVERDRLSEPTSDIDAFLARSVALLPAGQFRLCLDASAHDGSPQVPACDGAATHRAVKIWWDDDFDGVAEARVVMAWITPG